MKEITSCTILIVDDDQVMRDFARLVLANAGFQTATADSGLQALELIGEKPFDLILLDIQMPGLNGLETLKRIRKIADIPVILFSNIEGEQSVVEGFIAGAADYIYKPPRPKNLIARIRSVLIENGRQPEGDEQTTAWEH